MKALEDHVACVCGVEGIGGPLGGETAVLEVGIEEVDSLVEDGVLVVWVPEEDHGEPSTAMEEAVNLIVGCEAIGREEGGAMF